MNRENGPYLEAKSPEERDTLIRSLLPLVNYLVSRVSMYLPAGLPRDYLTGHAVSTLIEALNRYHPGCGQTIEEFCSREIRKILNEKVTALRGSPGEKGLSQPGPTAASPDRQHSPIKLEIGGPKILPAEEFSHLLEQVKLSLKLSGPAPGTPGKNRAPLSKAKPEISARLHDIFKQLPKEQLQVLCLYYIEELTRDEIAEVMSVTEAQVSQLHSSAMARFRLALEEEKR